MSNTSQLPFFVYGTLLPDQPNFHLWEADIEAIKPATFLGGRLHDMGYYPMLVTAVGEAVQGMVVTVTASQYDAVLQRLDALEGYDPNQPDNSAYRRRKVEVVVANGRSQQAWVYLGQAQLVQGKPVVSDGDWEKYSAENQSSLQKWWDAISSVDGLHDLLQE